MVNHSEEDACEIVAIFNNMKDLEKAVDELFASGLDNSQISMLAEENNLGEKLIIPEQNIEELANDPSTPRAPYVANENIGAAQGGLIGGLMYVGSLAAASAVIAAGGTIAATLAAAAIAGGGSTLIGFTLSKILGTNHAAYLEQQLKQGGLILWINVQHTEKEPAIYDILNKYNARDIHKHCIPRKFLTP